jgi:hypothetical protein
VDFFRIVEEDEEGEDGERGLVGLEDMAYIVCERAV